jgi:hypothetical protein
LTALSGTITNNFGIGGNLGVASAFSAATGVFSGNFSAASGTITNNFGIGGNLGVASAFSAATGVFSGNFSAASGNISNDFSIGGNLTALSGTITNFSAASGVISGSFSAGNSSLAALTVRGGIITITAANPTLNLANANFLSSISYNSSNQMVLDTGESGTNTSEIQFRVAGNTTGTNPTVDVKISRGLFSTAGQISIGFISTPAAIANTLCTVNSVIVNCSSLREFKTNIKNMDNALTDIKKLRPVVYNWKGDGKKDLGFIAEEVVDVNPIYGEYGGQNGELTGVRYMHLTSLLTKGIQEQQYTIELMKEVDKNQEEKLDTLDTSLSDKYNTLENDVKNYDQKFADIDDKLKKLEDFESKLDSLKVSDFENLIATLTNSLEALSMSTEEGSLTINSGLTVTGDTLFNNANFTGDVKFGNIKINTLENSINVLGAECVADTSGNCETNKLSIMSNKAGIIDIFSGVITLTPQGNITATRIEVNEVVSKEVIAENIQVTGFGNPLKNETCKAGEMKFGNKSEEGVEEQESFMYVCVSDNTWKRSSLNSY